MKIKNFHWDGSLFEWMAHSSSGWLTLRVGVCLLLLFCFGNVVALGGEVEKGQNLIDIIVEFFRNIFSTFTGQAIVGVTPIPATGEWHEIKIKNFYFGGLNEN